MGNCWKLTEGKLNIHIKNTLNFIATVIV